MCRRRKRQFILLNECLNTCFCFSRVPEHFLWALTGGLLGRTSICTWRSHPMGFGYVCPTEVVGAFKWKICGSLQVVGAYKFQSCGSLQVVGAYKFQSCESLQVVGAYKFQSCESLQVVEASKFQSCESLQVVGAYQFQSCESLQVPKLQPQSRHPSLTYQCAHLQPSPRKDLV